MDTIYDDMIIFESASDNYIQSVLMEGTNIDIKNAIYKCKKDFRKHAALLRKAIKSQNTSDAKKELSICKKIIKDTRNTINNLGDDSVSTALLGIVFLVVVSYIQDFILLLTIIGYPVVIIRNLKDGIAIIMRIVKDIKNNDISYNTLNLYREKALGYLDMMDGYLADIEKRM